MRNKILMLVLSAAVIASFVVVGCAPEAAPPEGEVTPPEEEKPSPAAPEEEVIKWQVVTPYPESNPVMPQLRAFCDSVGVLSGGRLLLTAYPGGAIVPGLAELEAVEEGTVEAMYCGPGLYPGRLGEGALVFGTSFPGGPGPFEYCTWWYHAGGGELQQELYDRAGCDVVTIGPVGGVGPELFGWFNKRITSLDDFNGLKFRTIGMWGETLKSLGASVVTMPGGELYHALERGVLDAFEYSTPATDYPLGFYEIAKYVVIPGIHQPHSVLDVTVGGDAWRALSPKLQAILREAAAAETAKGLTWVNFEDAKAWEKIKETGVEVVVLPKDVQAAIVEAAARVIEEHAAEDEFFAKCVHSQQDFLKFYRKYEGDVSPIPSLTMAATTSP